MALTRPCWPQQCPCTSAHQVPTARARQSLTRPGCCAPLRVQVQHASLRRLAALQQRGNPSWDDLFGQVMPAAAGHIRGLLGMPPAAEPITVQFGHNSHELVVRLLAALQERVAGGGVLRVLTSEMEFYSVTRQLNRLAQSRAARLQVGGCCCCLLGCV